MLETNVLEMMKLTKQKADTILGVSTRQKIQLMNFFIHKDHCQFPLFHERNRDVKVAVS